MIAIKILSPYHGTDLDRMIYKESHIQPGALSSRHGAGNIFDFPENRHVSKKDSLPAPDLTGVNRQLCGIPGQVYDSSENRMKRERIDRPVSIRARDRYFQKSRMFAKRIYRTVTKELLLIRFQKDRMIPVLDLMSSHCVGFNFMNIKRIDDSEDRINVIP